MDSLRVTIDIVAGVVPGKVITEYTKRFIITSDMWYAQGEYENRESEAKDEMLKIYGYASEYMRDLWNPSKVNWVRMDWIYF